MCPGVWNKLALSELRPHAIVGRGSQSVGPVVDTESYTWPVTKWDGTMITSNMVAEVVRLLEPLQGCYLLRQLRYSLPAPFRQVSSTPFLGGPRDAYSR